MKYLLFFSLCFIASHCFAQETSLVSNSDTYIGYSKSASDFTIVVEDLRPSDKSDDAHISKPDFKEQDDMDYILIEFDRNNDGKVNKGDIGFRVAGVAKHYYFRRDGGRLGGVSECKYLLYEGWPGWYMNSLSRGCENKASKAQFSSAWEANDHSSKEHPKWKISVPLKEIITPTSKEIGVRVKIFRSATAQLFSYPERLDDASFQGMLIPLSSNTIAADAQKEKAAASKSLKANSLSRYRTKMEYDGLYIDMGGKYAELQRVQSEPGVIAASSGKQTTNFFGEVPFVSSISAATVVPTVKKIIVKGAAYDAAFIESLRLSRIENFNEQNLTTNIDNRQDDVRLYAISAKLGSRYSLKSNQPDALFSPSCNKLTFTGCERLFYDKKTLANGSTEIYPSVPLEKGRLYVLWNASGFWLFQKE